MSYDNPWMFNGEPLESEDIENFVGMVYLLKNKSNGKRYIGKKFFWKTVSWKVNTKSKNAKNAKKKKKKRVESDWKEYYGSSKELLEDMKNGLDNIERHVLRLCFTKTECAYYELKEQVDREVLLSEKYYNDFIGGKISGKHLR